MENSEPQQEDASKKRSSRTKQSLGFGNRNKFDNWEVGTNYKCEKLLGAGSYGQVVQAI